MRLAVLDLGSNSFHLVVVDTRATGEFTPVIRQKEMLGLGVVVARHGYIPEPDADRARHCFRRLLALAQAAGAETVIACATAAVRQASNGAQLVSSMEAEDGVAIRILSGDDEARLVFDAVLASIRLEDSSVVCFDVGGGSLEVIVGGAHGPDYLISAELGASRLGAELVHHDPPWPAEIAALRSRIGDCLGPIAAASPYRPAMAVATGGVVRDLARLAASRRQGSTPASINQLRIGTGELRRIENDLLALSTDGRARLPGIERARARVAPLGAVMLGTALECFGLDRITVARWGLREGLILNHLRANSSGMAPTAGDGPRSSSVGQLLRRFNTSDTRGRRRAELATALFDATQALHQLDPNARELLRFAALLADIGRHVSFRSSHKHSAYLVEHGNLRGFDPEEIAILAALARFHRGSEPTIDHTHVSLLVPARQRQTLALAALLRIAHGLGATEPEGTGVAFRVDHSRRSLTIHDPNRPDDKNGSPSAALFEKVFGWSVQFSTEQPSLVA